MTVSPGWYGPEPHDYGRMLASTADRERGLDVLKAGFAEGRLTKDEYDERVDDVQAARTYADLVMVTSDLPGGQQAVMPAWPPAAPVWQPSKGTNGFAVASLILGIGQLVTLGLTGIPAIILGHTALNRISRTGEDGNGFAVAGVTLGWIGLPITAFIWLLVFLFLSHPPG